AKLAQGIDTISFENRYRCKDGSYRWLSWSAAAATTYQLIYAVGRDISDRKRSEEALEQARAAAERAMEEAERANRAKSEFLSRMSHELRTPLNAILGFGQLLDLGTLDEEQRESVEQILKGGRHLLDLINGVLDIARIETGRIPLSVEPVAADEVASEVVDLIRPLAAERGVEVRFEDLDVEWIMADRQRVKQVLLNLLSNGVKYNRAGGTVVLRGRRAPGDRVAIEVSDNGPGIAPADVARLFVPFERLGAESTGIEGTGLGLALSKRLAEAMGGTLEVESVAGQGCTFSLVV